MFTLVRGGPSLSQGVCEFLITSAQDLDDIPDTVRPGSIAYSADRSLRYTLDNDGVWRAETAGENRIASAIEGIAGTLKVRNRVLPLELSEFASGNIVETVGIPMYVSDISDYSEYSITETGWYVFARVFAPEGVTVPESPEIEGAAGYIATQGDDHIDVAVKFEVASMSKKVIIDWGETEDTFIFSATDLAIRNLDYRTTFYVYDIAPFATWSWKFAEEKAVDAAKFYYVKDGNDYVPVEAEAGDAIPAYYEKVFVYNLTADETFQDGKTYYTENDGEYTAAEVVVGDAVTAETYYEQSEAYVQTQDEVFQDGKTYYTFAAEVYTAAEVTTGESVPASTYYELDSETGTYALTADETFQDGKTYYTKTVNVYSEATVTEGAAVPAYYVHSKVTFQGMTRNITYKLDEIIDCPSEFVLPAIEDDGHGAWFEIRLRHSGSFSSTLVPLDEEVKIATEHTQAETAGINMIDLHYNNVGGVKIWRFMNTHSSIPA